MTEDMKVLIFGLGCILLILIIVYGIFPLMTVVNNKIVSKIRVFWKKYELKVDYIKVEMQLMDTNGGDPRIPQLERRKAEILKELANLEPMPPQGFS
jgi:hypothetical protein